MPCELCGNCYEDELHGKVFCEELEIYTCKRCRQRVEDNHRKKGKYVVHRCKSCKKVSETFWVPYKKRGRPLGSKNRPKPRPERLLRCFGFK